MVGAFGEVQVMDWGLAKVLGSTAPDAASPYEDQSTICTARGGSPGSSTEAGLVLGTPAYMPPEQARGEVEHLDERCDVFALGAILCQIFIGRPPYEGKLSRDVLTQAQQARVEPVLELLDRCGAENELVTLARQCLAVNKQDRPATAGQVAEAMSAYQVRVRERLRQAELERARAEVKAREERKRRRIALALAAAVLLLMLGAGAAATWHQQDQAERAGRQSLREESIRNALAEAHQGRDKLHATLAKPGGVFRLLNKPEEWIAQIEAAHSALRRAQELQTSSNEPTTEDVQQQIEDLAMLLDQDQANRRLALDLEKVREGRAGFIESKYDLAWAMNEYPRILQNAGFTLKAEREGQEAAQIRQSPVKEQLVAALDDWAAVAWARHRLDLHKHLLRVARRAAPDSFNDRVRDPANWSNPEAFKALTATALKDREALARVSPQMLYLLGTLLGDGPEAQHWLLQAQELHPADFWLNFSLGNALARSKPQQAQGFYRAALAVRPSSAVVHANLAYFFMEQNDPQRATVYIQKALALDHNYAAAWAGFGLSPGQLQEKLVNQAKRKQAAPAEPPNLDDFMAWMNKGAAKAMRKDFSGAAQDIKKAIEQDPKNAKGWAVLALVLHQQKEYQEATAVLQKATKMAPNDAWVWAVRGHVLQDQKDYAGAVAAYEKVLDLDVRVVQLMKSLGISPAAAWIGLGLVRENQRDYPTAEKLYRTAIEFDPQSVAAWSNLGNALNMQGKPKEAEGCFRRALKIDPQNVPAWNGLGVARENQADVSAAEQHYQKALELDPQDFYAWGNLGNIRTKQGNAKEAERCFRQALKFNEATAPAWSGLAIALNNQGDFKGAIAAYQKAATLDPNSPNPLVGLAELQRHQGDFAAALASFQQALARLSPQHPWHAITQNQIQFCRRLLDLEKRLDPVLQGEHAKPAEQADLADLCGRFKKRYLESVRLYDAAFLGEPALADDLNSTRRYNAACAALLAAGGQGPGADKLADADRAKLRQKALGWLQADVQGWKKLLQNYPPAAALARKALEHWQRDVILASVREEKALAELPTEDQHAWRQLWTEAAQLLKQVSAGQSNS
jgi:serine/threonine-protein kinase